MSSISIVFCVHFNALDGLRYFGVGGAAVSVDKSAKATIVGSIFSSNEAVLLGGAINAERSANVIIR